LPNADHRRSRLVRLTDLGERRYAAIDRRQIDWVNRVAHGLDRSDLEATTRVLEKLCARLEAEDETERVWTAA
jgi:DNA-binding MarR family transcriptional regulator